MIQIMKSLFGVLGFILAVTYSLDLLFDWPDSGFDTFYLIKLIAYIVGCSSVFWIFLLKDKLNKKSEF
jgi:hypothetical protein